MTQDMTHHLRKWLQHGGGRWDKPRLSPCRRCQEDCPVVALRPIARFGRIWHICPECLKEMVQQVKAGESLENIWKFAEEIMNAENEMTVAKFAAEFAARFPDENPETIKTKIYQWIAKGQVPHKRVPANRLPEEDGMIVVTADPATFEPPYEGPGPVPPGDGLRVSEVARRLNVPRPTVYFWLKKAGLAGGRVPQALFEEWEQERKR